MGVPALPAGPPGRAGSCSPGRASARPRAHRGPAQPPARGRRAPSGAGAGTPLRTARLKHGALPTPPRRSESPPEAAAAAAVRPSSAPLTSPTRRAPPAPGRPWRLPRRSPAALGAGGTCGDPRHSLGGGGGTRGPLVPPPRGPLRALGPARGREGRGEGGSGGKEGGRKEGAEAAQAETNKARDRRLPGSCRRHGGEGKE